MIRVLIFFLVVLAIGGGFAWLADRPGDMVISWQGQQIEMSLMVGVAIVVAIFIALAILWWLMRTILASPYTARRYFSARKRDRGYQALSTGLLAAGAGDAVTARKMNRRTKGLLSADREPLIHLLDAQTALIEGNHEAARAKFESMADDPETRDLALRGLYLEARRLNAPEAAQHYAERAAEVAPHLPWAAQAALEFRSREGNWDEALRLLEKQRMGRTVRREDADRKKAVLLTARAMQRLDGDPRGARDDALEAVRLSPDLVPAAVTAAKALFREDNLRKGTRILERTWKADPHPEVAEAYVRARIGDSVLDRLKRAERLEALKPNHTESLLAVARAALDAGQYDRARTKAEAAARQQSREGTYLLLADIEEAQTNDQGRVRHWLSQAVRAGREPTWTADGYVAESWGAVSPVSGKLDAFVWRVPVEQVAGPVEEGRSSDTQAERAIRSLPPVRKAEPAAEEPTDVAVEEGVQAPPERAPATIEAEPERAPQAVNPAPPDAASARPAIVVAADDAKEPAGAIKPAAENASNDSPADDLSKGSAGKTVSALPGEGPAEETKPDGPAGDVPPEASPVSPRPVRDRRNKDVAGAEQAHPFVRPPDDPGIDEDGDEPAKPRFRLF